MVIYFVADRQACAAVRAHGFSDGSRLVTHPLTRRRWHERGVWFSDVPGPDEHQAYTSLATLDRIALSIPEDRVIQYEILMPGQSRRRWYIPAAVANGYLSNVPPVVAWAESVGLR